MRASGKLEPRMIRWLAVLMHLLRAFIRSRSNLAIENAALRQQLLLPFAVRTANRRGPQSCRG